MAFIDKYLKHTKDYESPGSFWLWSAYATVAGVMRDNAWTQYGDKKLFANIYVLLLADSAGRKDAPVSLSKELLKSTGTTKIISGRSSIQGILDELARAETSRETGKIGLKGGSAVWYAPELAAGIVGDDAAVNILTDIYDGKTDFKSILRNSPSFKIDQIVFSALMASNEAMVKSVYDTRAVHGGLLRRTLLVIPNEIREPNSLWSDPTKEEIRKLSIKEMTESLIEISKTIKGEMTFPVETRSEYDKWYHNFRKVTVRSSSDKTGVAGSIHTTIKKLAMVIAADDLSNEIKPKHMEQAIDHCIGLLPNYDAFVISSGKSDIAQAGSIIIMDLLKANDFSLTRRDIINRHWQDIGVAEQIDKILITLQEGGSIVSIISGTSMNYRLSDKYIEKLRGKGVGK